MQFGSALPDEIHDNQIISIPGISGREKREISMKTLSKIIHARMEEIFDQVYVEVKGSGYSNKLIAGLVVTGGGSQLKHLKQMVEYTTGFSTRIGFPTVHLAKDTAEEIKNPMYATGLGLILKGYEYIDRERAKRKNIPIAVEEKKEEVKTEVVVEKVETTEEQKKKKAPGGFKNIFDSALSWFEDKGVNKDFE